MIEAPIPPEAMPQEPPAPPEPAVDDLRVSLTVAANANAERAAAETTEKGSASDAKDFAQAALALSQALVAVSPELNPKIIAQSNQPKTQDTAKRPAKGGN